MTISLIKTGIILFSFSVMGTAHSNELINFGKSCLKKEERLNQTRIKLNLASIRAEQGQIKNNQAVDDLKRYKAEKEKLETSMTECNETTPNSAYCHQIRRQYNALNYRITRAEADALDKDIAPDESIIDFEYEKAVFKQEYENFLALCRDSNAHYAFIQSPNAYSAVCSNDAAKNSITCSFF
ncbi:hypothetical protein C0J08_07930 [Marinomonas sp. CT5]|uniref:hypothetical protein n=1 Tax=Marinomonas sp. CT5 TaxID=2066133 RepID=UPI001848E772|nr:hypothetical protein [Marinomonas sp. CT5]NVK75443.1 hypothetical protein [Oceanospirillaceae bacterium]QUX95355.1 hypothetical protein C0J08_07930 [Marinomonas sp. CT5]